VYAVVNVTVLVLRKDRVEHKHFHAGRVLPVIGAIACAYLVLPWSSERPLEQYEIAGLLLAIGIVLWGAHALGHRMGGPSRPTGRRRPLTLGRETVPPARHTRR
jgi:APA family basic amino acid/polyamine antiporter